MHCAPMYLVREVGIAKPRVTNEVKLVTRDLYTTAHSQAEDAVANNAAPPEPFEDKIFIRVDVKGLVIVGFSILGVLNCDGQPWNTWLEWNVVTKQRLQGKKKCSL